MFQQYVSRHKYLIFIFATYFFWLFISNYFIIHLWQSPMIAGADGSGHVALLHLYHQHIFPALNGSIPEFWDGMPFPVFYPPLFYWLGATLMSIFGIDATLAAKFVTTFSFLLLPFALFRLSKNIGLDAVESSIAVCLAGVIVCGSNVASLSGIGLLGLFEVGLYSQTLGFGFLCLWISSLVKAEDSVKETILSIIFLSATILSNVHNLPLAAAFAFFWLVYRLIIIWKRKTELTGKQIVLKHLYLFGLLASPVLISGIWLFPLIWWYQYAVGKTLLANNLFFSLGSLNLIWIVCLFVAWTERKRNKSLAILCLMIFTAAFASLAPISFLTQSVPFQPARTLSGAIILAILPTVALLNRLLKEVSNSSNAVPAIILTLSVCFLAWLHPPQTFGIAALSEPEANEINQIEKAVNETDSGKILVEIVESQAVFNSPSQNTREMAKSRALSHQLAMNGKQILWNVFREQALSAPFATAVNNLFSNSKEVFGLDGTALRESVKNELTPKAKLKLARTLGITNFLIKSESQIELLRKEDEIQELWQINGWHYFKLKEPALTRKADLIPVFAWLKVKTKNRSGNEFEFFNLAEYLAFNEHSEINVLYAKSFDTNVFEVIRKLGDAILVIDETEISAEDFEQLKALANENTNLKILFITGKYRASGELVESENIKVLSNNYELLSETALQIVKWQLTPASTSSELTFPQAFKVNFTYFPARLTTNNNTFLDGFGRTIVYNYNETPVWKSHLTELVSIICLVFGVLSGVVLCLIKNK